MSFDTCAKCKDRVDTMEDPGCYVKVDGKKVCLCKWCRGEVPDEYED